MNMVMHRPTVPLFSARWDSRPARRSGRGFLSSRSFYACEDQFGDSHLDEKHFWGFGPSWCFFCHRKKLAKTVEQKTTDAPNGIQMVYVFCTGPIFSSHSHQAFPYLCLYIIAYARDVLRSIWMILGVCNYDV